jgi:hypothetical protein
MGWFFPMAIAGIYGMIGPVDFCMVAFSKCLFVIRESSVSNLSAIGLGNSHTMIGSHLGIFRIFWLHAPWAKSITTSTIPSRLTTDLE